MRLTTNKVFVAWGFGLLLICFSLSTWAGVFSVTPVRIYMTPKDRALAVTVTNEGDQELVMQADIYEWKQKPGGEDVLTPSEDLFLSPPILKIAPKSRQVVRLAKLKRAQDGTGQATYRMIVREIPEAKPVNNDIQVQVALAFSMPIFITPNNSKSHLDCGVARLASDKLKIICENTGNAYSHPTAFLLSNLAGAKIAAQETGAYILPAIKREFELKRPDGNISAGKAKLAVSLDDGTTQIFEVMVSE